MATVRCWLSKIKMVDRMNIDGIDKLNVSMRVKRALRRAGATVPLITGLTALELMSIRGIGEKSATEILEALDECKING